MGAQTWTWTQPSPVRVGWLMRAELLTALDAAGVRLNNAADTLLAGQAFDELHDETVSVVRRSVGALGLTRGGVLTDIFRTAETQGLFFCPPTTGPYLRLAIGGSQIASPDSVMSNGRAPTGSITVASEHIGADENDPRGFYLRVVGSEPWLRGYRCSGDHVWSAEDVFAFRIA